MTLINFERFQTPCLVKQMHKFHIKFRDFSWLSNIISKYGSLFIQQAQLHDIIWLTLSWDLFLIDLWFFYPMDVLNSLLPCNWTSIMNTEEGECSFPQYPWQQGLWQFTQC